MDDEKNKYEKNKKELKKAVKNSEKKCKKFFNKNLQTLLNLVFEF